MYDRLRGKIFNAAKSVQIQDSDCRILFLRMLRKGSLRGRRGKAEHLGLWEQRIRRCRRGEASVETHGNWRKTRRISLT